MKQTLFILLAFSSGILLTLLFNKLLSRRDIIQKINASSAELLEKMTHQVRNHLSGILLVTSNLLAREGSQDKTGKLASIRHEVLRTQLLLNNILIYTQLQNNHLPLEKNKLDLSPIITGLTDEIGHINYQNKQPTSQLAINGNAFLLRTALHNLIDNAVKFSKHAPSPDITVRRYDEHVELQFIDYGKGLSPAQTDQVFRPKGLFNKNNKSENLALGLFVTKQIIELHQGTILLHSKENDGTTIIITLPTAS